jgi:mRNA interferase RelE/StbE
MFEVILSPEAQAFYEAADRPLARKPARCFSQLERDPRRHNNIKRLTGEVAGAYRYRVGDWRVIYDIDDGLHRVFVLSIAHRREAYD